MTYFVIISAPEENFFGVENSKSRHVISSEAKETTSDCQSREFFLSKAPSSEILLGSDHVDFEFAAAFPKSYLREY